MTNAEEFYRNIEKSNFPTGQDVPFKAPIGEMPKMPKPYSGFTERTLSSDKQKQPTNSPNNIGLQEVPKSPGTSESFPSTFNRHQRDCGRQIEAICNRNGSQASSANDTIRIGPNVSIGGSITSHGNGTIRIGTQQ